VGRVLCLYNYPYLCDELLSWEGPGIVVLCAYKVPFALFVFTHVCRFLAAAERGLGGAVPPNAKSKYSVESVPCQVASLLQPELCYGGVLEIVTGSLFADGLVRPQSGCGLGCQCVGRHRNWNLGR
jgi:hypothetical protein